MSLRYIDPDDNPQIVLVKHEDGHWYAEGMCIYCYGYGFDIGDEECEHCGAPRR